MQARDIERLRHMRDAGREALSFVAGKDRQALDRERMLALSLIRLLEVIGEAASTVSAEGRAAYSAIPWRDMIAMRNRLIHGYFNVSLDIVWDTVTLELPDLLVEVEQALAVVEHGDQGLREDG